MGWGTLSRRAGHRRGRPGIAPRNAVGLVLAFVVLGPLLAGCGRSPLLAGTASPNPSTSTGPASITNPATAPGNRASADREAIRLLSLASLPPSATETRAVPTQGLLAEPAMGMPEVKSLVDRTRVWQVDLPYAQTLAWLSAHPPVGLTASGSRSEADGTLDGLDYGEPDTIQWTEGQLAVGLAPLSPTRTLVRVDGEAIWLDPTPRSDVQTGPRLRVTATRGCPDRDRAVVGVTNPGPALNTSLLPAEGPTSGLICVYTGLNGRRFALTRHVPLTRPAARRLAAVIQHLPLSHTVGGTMFCPDDDARADVLILAYPDRPDVDLWYRPRGCSTIANGFITAKSDEALATAVTTTPMTQR